MNAHENTPVVTAAQALSSETLLRFLNAQRWFAAKGLAPTSARVIDAMPAPWGNGAYALLRVAVVMGDTEQLYQLAVAQRDALPQGAPQSAIIGGGERQSPGLVTFDAAHDPDFRRGLVIAVANGASARGANGVEWVFEPVGERIAAPDDVETNVSPGEQSNTSIFIGDHGILKLFRTLATGVHPDVELSTFLTTRAAFANTPPVLGIITIRTPDGVQTAGMAQRLVPGAKDAWSYALDRSKSYFAAPADRDVSNDFVADAKRLGAITRAMHESLATDDDDPAVAPEPATHEDLDRWAHRAQHMVRSSLTLLERQLSSSAFPKQRVNEAQALVRRGDHYAGWIDEIDDEPEDDLGMCIRVHGDYHLGQVLRGADGDFAIIDFEGEPSKSLEERREKTSPLRDVAGMLRSFAYASATLAMSVENTVDAATRELRAARWERDVRTAFLSGYLGEPSERDDHPDVLPEDEAQVRRLIVLFEMEKAFYELAYELNNRPDWAWIPMRGISKLAFR